MSIVRWLSVALLALSAAACGARSGLPDPVRRCSPLQIGMIGIPGTQDGSDFQGWLEAAGADVQRIQTTPDEPLTADALQPFNVVVLELLTRDYTAAEASALEAWVAAGGGVVSMTGWHFRIVDDLHTNSLIAPLDVAYTGQLLWGPVMDLAPHPITAGLTSLVFKGGFVITDLGGETSARTPIAFLPGAVPVGYAIQVGKGRGFVWGDDWIEYTTESTFLPRLWVQVFTWISSSKSCVLLTAQS
jgi:hypothetical protein